MDGLLADTEPLWRQAESEIFSQHGMPVTPEMARQTTGLRINEVIAHWQKNFGQDSIAVEIIEKQIINRLCGLIYQGIYLLPGAEETLQFFNRKKINLALASSSPDIIIDAVLNTTSTRGYFQCIQSGFKLRYAKPHPEIFLIAAERLGSLPFQTLVFEDTIHGVVAAKAARMKVVAIPDSAMLNDVRFNLAELVLPAMSHFNEYHWEKLNLVSFGK